MSCLPAAIPPRDDVGFDRRDYRRALGQFATGVTVVTTRTADGTPVGLTVNAFTSVSLDPPFVLWCLALSAGSAQAFLATSRFAVNVLGERQAGLAQRFATRHTDRFAGVAWRVGPGGMPLLDGAIAHLVCRSFARQVAGDHLVCIGEVERYEYAPGEPPLVFHGGGYGGLAALPGADADYSGMAPKMKVA
jgi:flavin reductase (DIM6/NTAB) family NADH-FMN oxidoreductase RutF